MRTFIATILFLWLGAGAALAQQAGERTRPGDGDQIAATAAPPSVAPPPAALPASAPPASPARRGTSGAGAGNLGGGDGPADVLNGFVLKELAQCRALPGEERRACCERLLHPNACTE